MVAENATEEEKQPLINDVELTEIDSNFPEQTNLTNHALACLIVCETFILPSRIIIEVFSYYLMGIYGMTYSEINYSDTARNIGKLLGLFIPSFIDQWFNGVSYRNLFTFSLIIIALETLSHAIYYKNALIFLIITRFINGFIVQIFMIYRIVFIAQYNHHSEHPKLYSYLFIGKATSRIYIAIFAVFLLSHYVIDMICFAVCIFGCAILVYFAVSNDLKLSKTRLNPEDTNYFSSFFVAMKLLVHSMKRCLMLTVLFCVGFGITSSCAIVTVWIYTDYGIGEEYYIMLLCQFGATVIGIILSKSATFRNCIGLNLSGDNQKKQLMTNGTMVYLFALLMILCGFVIVLIFGHDNMSYATVIVYQCMFKLNQTLEDISCSIIVANLVEDEYEEYRSHYVALTRTFNGIGCVLGTLIPPYLYDHYGLQSVFICLAVAFSIAAISMLILNLMQILS